MEILFWTVEVQQTPLRDLSLLCERNRCRESETGEEEILKALEHHQTGKTPTHSRAEKALRSSQASLNGSLSANWTTQPPAQTEQHDVFSPSKSTWVLTERVGERALLLSDLFILLQVTHPLSAVASTLCATSPRPVPLSPPWKPSCHGREQSLYMDKQKNIQLFGWEGSCFFLFVCFLAASVPRPYEAVMRVIRCCSMSQHTCTKDSMSSSSPGHRWRFDFQGRAEPPWLLNRTQSGPRCVFTDEPCSMLGVDFGGMLFFFLVFFF